MKSKRIYINARFLLQPRTGVERYAYEMCRAMVEEGADITLVCPKGGEIMEEYYDVSQFKIVRYGAGKSHIWEQLVLPLFFIGKKDYVLISFTGLGSIMVSEKIMTVHDLSFLENPSWFSKIYYNFYRIMTPLAVRTSRKVVTVSNFSKNEICRFYSFVKADDVHVIPNAVDKGKFGVTEKTSVGNIEVADGYKEEEKYILAVSSLDPRKNFPRLIEAFSAMPEYKLKIVGGTNAVFGKKNGAQKNTENIEFLGRVSDKELRKLYSEAAAFIFPSLYEGFGLPPLEAMASGCLVLSSDIPVLRETCGEAALYFSPVNVEKICSAVKTVMTMTDVEKSKMIRSGYDNVERFSWCKSARELLAIL